MVFVPQGHGKQKLIIPRMLEDKLRQKMGCGVYRTVHIAHDGAGRAEWMTASYEGRIGAVRVEASSLESSPDKSGLAASTRAASSVMVLD